jgi:protein O-GlcNAc transferase
LEDNDLAKTNLIKYAELHNIGPERLIFAPRIDRESHLERIMLADIALDTRVYNGHTTTTDALQACVPVVTLLGKHFASRVSSSLLMSIGLEDLITYDIQEYEEKIIELSTNEIYFKEIKEKLSNNEYITNFYDVKKFTHELESSLKSIFKN